MAKRKKSKKPTETDVDEFPSDPFPDKEYTGQRPGFVDGCVLREDIRAVDEALIGVMEGDDVIQRQADFMTAIENLVDSAEKIMLESL